MWSCSIFKPVLNGLDQVVRIKTNLPDIQLIYSAGTDRDIVDEAFRLGATAYLLKNCRLRSARLIRGALRGWKNRRRFPTRSNSMKIASFRDVPAPPDSNATYTPSTRGASVCCGRDAIKRSQSSSRSSSNRAITNIFDGNFALIPTASWLGSR